jgi:lipopolysaccharide heptosyltransferase I
MFTAGTAKEQGPGPHILVVRIGSMGDVIHALPAVATLKHSFPGSVLTWIVHPRWAPLLEANPYIDRLIPFDRRSLRNAGEAWRLLRSCHYDFAVDLQGLMQSALIASLARAERIYGFHQSLVREKVAAAFYSKRVRANAAHVVDRNLELAAAAGASTMLVTFPLPDGRAEGELPEGPFVLANPVAGWGSKQWPLEHYSVLAERLGKELGLALVVNGAPGNAGLLAGVHGALTHVSGISGLIHATRRAAAVIGTDSGPMHLAAAMGRPGVAIFGPTDPQRNGPYGGSFTVLRSPGAVTTYKRLPDPDCSMCEISPGLVFDALKRRLATRDKSAGCCSA